MEQSDETYSGSSTLGFTSAAADAVRRAEEEGRLRALLLAKRRSTSEDFYKSKLADVMRAFQETLPKSDSDYYTVNAAIRIFEPKSGPRLDELRPSFFTAYVAKALKTKKPISRQKKSSRSW